MRRIWKFLKWTGIVLAIFIAVLLIIVATLNWRANSRLEQRLAAIRSAGDPVTLMDLTGEPVPAEQNAVTYLRRVEQQVTAINAELGDVLGDAPLYRVGGKLNEAGAAKVRTTLEAYADVVPTLAQAAACPAYDPMYDFSAPQPVVLDTVLQRTSPCREVARVLMLQADLQIFEGRLDEALQTCVLTLQYGRHLENEPFTLGYLVSLAIRGGTLEKINQILAAGPISPESRTLLADELARNDGMQGFVHCLKTERVHGVASFREMSLGKLPLWYVKNWESEYLDVMAAELAMGASPKHMIATQLDAQRTRVASSGALTSLAHPALEAAREALDRVRASGRCLMVLSAFQQAAKEGGTDRLELDGLGLDKEFTTDPYTGKPLLTKQTPLGWVVYSVGRNGTDDGGAIGPPYDDIGAGPTSTP